MYNIVFKYCNELGNRDDVYVRYEMELIDSFGNCLAQDEDKCVCADMPIPGILIKCDKVKGDRLTIICTIELRQSSRQSESNEFEFSNTKYQLKQRLSDNYGKYLKNRELSDVT